MKPHSSREQIAIAIGALSSASIRAKLDSGELTELGKSVAEEELARRERDGDVLADDDPPLHSMDIETPLVEDLFRRPFGWSWPQWLAVSGVCLLVVLPFGATARNKADQSFLFGVILLQAVVLAGILRAFAAIFSSSSALGVLGKLTAVGALCVVVFALTVCSEMAKHGWGGG